MWYGGYTSVTKKCFCLFDCQCDKVERAIADWTSDEAFKTMKSRLRNLTDPTEIFARMACVLFNREILDGTMMKCTKDNLKKASIAFSFACSFANEDIDCASFYATCWQRFQQLVSELEQFLGRMRSRRLLTVSTIIEEVFPQDSDAPIGDPTLNSTANPESSPNQVVGFNPNSTSGVLLESSHRRADANPTVQAVENSSLAGEGDARFGRPPTRSMPSESAKKRAAKRSASKEVEKKPNRKTREPMSCTTADYIQIATNTSPTAVVQQKHLDSEKNEDSNTKPAVTSSIRPCLSIITPNQQPNVIDRSNWFSCPKSGCEYKSKFEWMLERHAKHHRRRLSRCWACNECGMDFPDERMLQRHGSVHKRRNDGYVCEECDFNFLKEDYLADHKNRFHKAPLF